MNHVWFELPDLSHETRHHSNLPNGLSQPWLFKDSQFHRLAHQMQIGFGFLVGKEEKYLRVRIIREPTSQTDAILAEVERNERYLQWLSVILHLRPKTARDLQKLTE